MKESGTEQPVWEKIEIKAQHQYTYAHSCDNRLLWKSLSAERFATYVWMSSWATLCLISHRVKGAVAGIPNFPEGRSVWRKKTENMVTCQEPQFVHPQMSNCGLPKCRILHGCVGCTADVTGDHHQAARMEAGHHRSQIDLEPQLKVFRLKVYKFRSKGCQGQVQDGVSYTWVADGGDVSLEMKGFIFSLGGCFSLENIEQRRTSIVAHLRNSVHPGHDSSHHQRQFIEDTYQEMHPFDSNLGHSLASAKVHWAWAQEKFDMACLSANFGWNKSILKLSIHLLVDFCKSLEKLFEQLIIMGLRQVCKHSPYDGFILRSRAVWIQDQLSLLLWWEGLHNIHLMTREKATYELLFSWTSWKLSRVQPVKVVNIVLLLST